MMRRFPPRTQVQQWHFSQTCTVWGKQVGIELQACKHSTTLDISAESVSDVFKWVCVDEVFVEYACFPWHPTLVVRTKVTSVIAHQSRLES
eukprot:scaffold230205_cov21-Tisochrysis_lutea.AAC.2